MTNERRVDGPILRFARSRLQLGTLSQAVTGLKVAFVSAEAFRPRVLLLDEPTSGLDPVMRKHLINAVVENLDNDQGRIVLFIDPRILEDVRMAGTTVSWCVSSTDSLIAQMTARCRTLRFRLRKSLTGVLYALDGCQMSPRHVGTTDSRRDPARQTLAGSLSTWQGRQDLLSSSLWVGASGENVLVVIMGVHDGCGRSHAQSPSCETSSVSHT